MTTKCIRCDAPSLDGTPADFERIRKFQHTDPDPDCGLCRPIAETIAAIELMLMRDYSLRPALDLRDIYALLYAAKRGAI